MAGLDRILATAPVWLPAAAGAVDPEGIVCSSRIRLARNLADHPFRPKLSGRAEVELVSRLQEAVAELPGSGEGFAGRVDSLPDTQRAVLFERRLISRELASGDHPGACAIDASARTSLMLGEEDHLRLQALAPGLDLQGALDRAIACDRQLEEFCDWAVHPRFGYLTACPTNIGTGLRASVMLHLAGLAEAEQLTPALRGLSKLQVAARGAQGEGSEALGHFYQISNQRTLGLTEADLIEQVGAIAQQLIEYERMAREHLLRKRRVQTEDTVFRAWGVLTGARLLSSKELIEHAASLRLGACLGMLPIEIATIDRLLIECQPAHLAWRHPELVETAERDRRRAELVRQRLPPPALV